MKTDRVKSLSQLYTLDDFRVIDEVKRTYRSGYVPVTLRAPACVIRRGCGPKPDVAGVIETMTLYTLRFYFALRVWEVALALTDYRFSGGRASPFTDHVWVDGDGPFRELRFSCPAFGEAAAYMWEMLTQVADSGAVQVCEGINCFDAGGVETAVPESVLTELPVRIETRIVVDTERLAEWEQALRCARKSLYRYSYDRRLRSFSWVEIRDCFTELTPARIALLNGEKMNRHTAIDDLFLSACYRLDFDRVKRMLRQGASVLALNDDGESGLQQCMEGVADDTGPIFSGAGLCDREAEAERIAGYLLDNGAEIDLFGYDGVNALTQACCVSSVRLVRFLLDRGADPNLNCRLTGFDIPWNERSTALSCVLKTICEEGDDGTVSEIRHLLTAAGARLYVDGYVPPGGGV